MNTATRLNNLTTHLRQALDTVTNIFSRPSNDNATQDDAVRPPSVEDRMRWLRCVTMCAIAFCANLLIATAAQAQAVTYTEIDLGSTGAAGSYTYASGTPPTYTVKGAGTGIASGGTSDNLGFAYTPTCGNIELSCRVASESSSASSAQAGLMIREYLASDSPTAAIAATPGSGV
jgi:hypothetical protein